MKVKFLSTEGDYLEASIEVNSQTLHIMDEFGGSRLSPGDEIDLDIYPGLLDEDESWESIFSGNPNKEKKLEHQSGWRYRAYGVIISIKPVIVDCGILQAEGPLQIHTNDDRVIGEPIAFTIERLDAS